MADADLNDAIVGGCRRREPAIDFLSVNDAYLEEEWRDRWQALPLPYRAR